MDFGIDILSIDGSMTPEERQAAVKKFNSEGPHSTSTGKFGWTALISPVVGTGTNLARASVLVLLVSLSRSLSIDRSSPL